MKAKNSIDYVEVWPAEPEQYIRSACKTFGLAEPVVFRDVKTTGLDNLCMDATLSDGTTYRLAHSPISEGHGCVINRGRSDAELAYISRCDSRTN